MTLRIATWNVLWRDRADRIDLVAAQLAALDADVVMLQETSPSHAARVAEVLGVEVLAVPDQSDDDQTSVPALLARQNAGAELIALPSGDVRNGWLLWADVTTNDETYRVATTHLSATSSAWRMCLDRQYAGATNVDEITDQSIRASVRCRLAELSVILSQLVPGDSDPVARVIIGGDFNFPPAGLEHRLMQSSGFIDAARDRPRLGSLATILAANPLVADHPDPAELSRPTAPGSSAPDYALDHFFASDNVTADDVWTFGIATLDSRWPSDHLGLAGEFSAT